jgi:SAM-dependent methyltransferase
MRTFWPRPTAHSLLLLLAIAASARAQPRTAEECEAAFPAAWGMAGKDVVWVPTFDAVVQTMLTMAQVRADDLVLDLGAGDGRIAIAAAKAPYGARAVGIEYDSSLAKRAECLVRVEGLSDRVRIVEGDIFQEDFGGASVVTLYLLPQLNRCVRNRVLALAPGTRVVSHQYTMAEWPPERSIKVQGRDVHLWVVPARVDGVWELQDSQGQAFTLELRQTFGTLSGELRRGSVSEPLATASVHGAVVRFTSESAGAAVRFSGTVKGGEITGVMPTGAAARTVLGRLRGGLRAAPWAEMPPDCGHYYGRADAR